MMKLTHDIEGDANKFKISPCKSKQFNLKVLKYIKDGIYLEVEVGKYVYAGREGKPRDCRQYFRIQISVVHDVTWYDWYITLRGRWILKYRNT